MVSIIAQALIIGLLLSGVVVGLSAIIIKKRGLARVSISDLVAQWIGVAAPLVVLQVASGVLHLDDNPIDRFFDEYPTRIFVAGVVLAGLLFGLRKRRRDVYGFLEIGVALITLFTFATSPFSSPLYFAIGFATPVYIIIRGLDNIDQYWEKEKAKENGLQGMPNPSA